MSLLSKLERTITIFSTEGLDSWEGPTEVEVATVRGILSLGGGSMNPELQGDLTSKQSARFHFAPFPGDELIAVGMRFRFGELTFSITTLDTSGRLPGKPYTCRIEGVRA